jgi:predicted MFS family arabinose efflux permease
MNSLSSQDRIILLLALAGFASASAFRICDPMLPQLATEFGASTGEAAATVMAFAVAYGLLQMFFGPVGDRYGKFRVIVIATFACAVGSVGAAMSTSLEMLIICRALSGAAGGGIIPLSMAWIGDNVPYEQRQATLARFLTGTILGMAAGQFAGGLIADTIGWRWAFVFLVMGYVVMGVLLWRELTRQTQEQSLQGHANTISIGAKHGFVAQVRTIFSVPWARMVLAIVFFEGMLVFGSLAFVPAYLHDRFGLSLMAAGAVGAVYAVGGMLYTLVAAQLIRRFGERGLVVSGGVVLCTTFLVYWLGPAWGWCVLASVLAGFGYYLLHATLQTHATQMVPSARGTAVAWFASFLFLGQAVGVSIAGVVVDIAGAAMLFGASAALLPLLAFIFARALQRRAQQA